MKFGNPLGKVPKNAGKKTFPLLPNRAALNKLTRGPQPPSLNAMAAMTPSGANAPSYPAIIAAGREED